MLKVNGRLIAASALMLFLFGCSMVPKEDSLTSVAGVENMEVALKDLNDPNKQSAFSERIKYVATTLSEDPSYKRIPLDNQEQKEWFTARAFLLWDGMISKTQFMEMGAEKFPEYTDSFNRVADMLLTK